MCGSVSIFEFKTAVSAQTLILSLVVGVFGFGDDARLVAQSAINVQPQLRFLVGNFPSWVTVGDLNGDGILDFITANANGDTVSVLLQW